MKGNEWLPKLGDVFSEQGSRNGGVERRFQEVGFDLRLTLREQSPARSGDKNNEERQPQVSRGATTHMDAQTPTQTAQTPQHIVDQMNALRNAGVQVGIPIIVQLDEKAVAALKNGHAPIGQDLARFSAKAAIAGAVGLGCALIFHVVTKPADPMVG